MIVAFIIHIHCLSSPLLPWISPHTFAVIPILTMYLSIPNCSIYKTFHHIIPCSVPLCEGMFYKNRSTCLLHQFFTRQFCSHPYKNRSIHVYLLSRFALLYRTSSPPITVPKALPWQMNRTLIMVLVLLVFLVDILFC